MRRGELIFTLGKAGDGRRKMNAMAIRYLVDEETPPLLS